MATKMTRTSIERCIRRGTLTHPPRPQALTLPKGIVPLRSIGLVAVEGLALDRGVAKDVIWLGGGLL